MGRQVAYRKASIIALALLIVFAFAIADAPAQGSRVVVKKSTAMEPETNEEIVADFLTRKERAEKAQRAIVVGLRKRLEFKRAEFDEARKKFDEARGRYAEVVGPLAKQGVTAPDDPRLPYEFDMQRLGPESWGAGPGYFSRKVGEPNSK